MKMTVTVMLALFLTTLQAQAQTDRAAEKEKSTSVEPVGAYSQMRAVQIQRKTALINLPFVQRNDINNDLNTLIAFDPAARMSIEEFREMSSLSQWALGQRQRMQMISQLEARRTVLAESYGGRRIGKAGAAKLALIEDKLNTLGEDAQLANVDMQNAMQRMQQTLQMMSNISKQQHDTAMSVIRKIGG